MNKKIKHIILISPALLLLVRLLMSYHAQKQEINRLETNLAAQHKTICYYKTLSGKTAAQQPVLQIKKQEVKVLFPGMINKVKDLKLKLNKIQNYSEAAVETQKQITTIIKDTIIHDTIHIKTFFYEDDYYTVKGIVQDDIQQVNIQSRDSLIQVIFKGKRIKPYLWIFSKRKLEQVISTQNPASTVTYTKYIQIVKP